MASDGDVAIAVIVEFVRNAVVLVLDPACRRERRDREQQRYECEEPRGTDTLLDEDGNDSHATWMMCFEASLSK
jgi:hypothetical protein